MLRQVIDTLKARVAFGGCKGIGRETHKMMLNHYEQTKIALVSCSPTGPGSFRAGIRHYSGSTRWVSSSY